MRRFSQETQRNYVRDVGRFATFLGRPPDTATADDLRRFQVWQQDDGVPVPTMNSIVSALASSSPIPSTARTGAQARPAGASAQLPVVLRRGPLLLISTSAISEAIEPSGRLGLDELLAHAPLRRMRASIVGQRRATVASISASARQTYARGRPAGDAETH
ncbi:phage integrase N-terminal SAM-like domain-containing protein [Mesorhizobium sp. AaZ16]|uniref:phage integrase N-terminal SAM-like domain-containing protein n=1 Tax=Mesorhizobium sp. AaZ16 TaxID=3402289 RepID=UPI00374F91E6